MVPVKESGSGAAPVAAAIAERAKAQACASTKIFQHQPHCSSLGARVRAQRGVGALVGGQVCPAGVPRYRILPEHLSYRANNEHMWAPWHMTRCALSRKRPKVYVLRPGDRTIRGLRETDALSTELGAAPLGYRIDRAGVRLSCGNLRCG